MSYLTLAEAAQYVQQETGVTIDATALLRAGALGYLIIVAAFSGSMRNLTTHTDDDVLGLLVIPPMHLLEIEINGEASIKGAFSLDGKTAYSPQVTRTREQLSILVSELDRVIPYVTEPKAAPPRAYQLGIARQKESPDGIMGWWDYTMDADFWWKQPTVSPQEAALLLCQLNPHDDDLAPEGSQNEETGPQEYKKLLRTFDGIQALQQGHRTLEQWVCLAQRDGLKYHSWIDDYQSAVVALRDGQTKAEAEYVLPALGAAVSLELAAGENEVGLSKRERQIRAIEGVIATLEYKALEIPTGGKKKVEAQCKSDHSDLFGGGSDPFKEAWQQAVKDNRVRTVRHNQYARK